MNEPCPFCGATLKPSSHQFYHWSSDFTTATCYTIALEHMECPECYSHTTTPEQSRRNKVAIQAIRKTYPRVTFSA